METLGSLCDKLSIANLKVWHVQEKVYEATRHGTGLDAETTKKLADANLQRTRLIGELDQLFADCLKSGKAPMDVQVKLT